MLLASSTDTGLAQTARHRIPAHLVRVHLGDVVELALQELACCVLALAADLADAWHFVEDALQLGAGDEVALTFGRLGFGCAKFGRQVRVDG